MQQEQFLNDGILRPVYIYLNPFTKKWCAPVGGWFNTCVPDKKINDSPSWWMKKKYEPPPIETVNPMPLNKGHLNPLMMVHIIILHYRTILPGLRRIMGHCAPDCALHPTTASKGMGRLMRQDQRFGNGLMIGSHIWLYIWGHIKHNLTSDNLVLLKLNLIIQYWDISSISEILINNDNVWCNDEMQL